MRSRSDKRTIIIILIILAVAAAAFLTYQLQKSVLATAKGKKVDASEGQVECKNTDKYFVIVGANHVLVKYKKNKDQIFSCAYIKESGDYEIATQAAGPFFYYGMTGNSIIIDEGTAPPPRAFQVYNLAKREQVYSSTYADMAIDSNKLNYWRMTNIDAVKSNCPDVDEYRKNGLGSGIEQYVTLNLSDLELQQFDQYRCVALQ